VGFLDGEVGHARVGVWVEGIQRGTSPEDVIIVGEVGEEDAEEETGCYSRSGEDLGEEMAGGGKGLRPIMRKVAKGAVAPLGGIVVFT